ncbi:MAG TPA: hypothetical protein VI758_03070, partial [Bacteroidota bacterium]
MLMRETPVREVTQDLERDFYSSYEWCLNPLLRLDELFLHLQEEFSRWSLLKADWQRYESVINCYLFICAIAGIVDDFLANRRVILAPLKARMPRIRAILGAVEWTVNLPFQLMRRARNNRILKWRRQWQSCVDDICESLINQLQPLDPRITAIHGRVLQLSVLPFPDSLLKERMRLPEGFRCQDLTHHDVLSMVDRFVGSHPKNERPLLIVGPRTAGSYFAPLARAYCLKLGWKDVAWLTVRPKLGVSSAERRSLRSMLKKDPLVLVMDDYPNTGFTLDVTVKVLRNMGVRKERITVVVPVHPVSVGRNIGSNLESGVKVLTLNPAQLYKEWLLKPQAAENIISDYFNRGEFNGIVMIDDPEIDELNHSLWDHYADGFHVRLKRVYEVVAKKINGEVETKRIFAKSVGWGWLGYHAYIAGIRLKEFVPGIVGLRDGILLTEWVAHRRTEHENGITPVLSSYVAARVNRLGLKEEPSLAGPRYGWGWLEARSLLRKAYGSYFGFLKNGTLINELKRRVILKAAFIDGRMRPEDWIAGEEGLVKVDFEHHNFGAPQLDFADSAFDLAAAVFEFGLSDQSERDFIRLYEEETCDTTVQDRLMLHKLVYGTVSKRLAWESVLRAGSARRRSEGNERMLAA